MTSTIGSAFPIRNGWRDRGPRVFFIVHLRLGPGPASAGRPGAASRSPVGPPPRSAPHAAEAAPAPRSARLPAPGAPHPSAPATPPLPASHPVPSATGSRWPRAHAPVPTPQLQQPLRPHSRPQTADHGAPLAAPPPAALHLPLHLAHLLHPRPGQVPSQRQRRPPPAHRPPLPVPGPLRRRAEPLPRRRLAKHQRTIGLQRRLGAFAEEEVVPARLQELRAHGPLGSQRIAPHHPPGQRQLGQDSRRHAQLGRVDLSPAPPDWASTRPARIA
jgi:hypothetical protein